jgi:hypothetical protein
MVGEGLTVERARLREVADQLKIVLLQDGEPDEALITEVQRVIKIHSIYIQLLSVLTALDRLDALPDYVSRVDDVMTGLVEDISAMTPETSLRALQALNTSIHTTYQVIREMTASQEASGVLAAAFAGLVSSTGGDDEDKDGLLKKLAGLSSDERQRVLMGAKEIVRQVEQLPDED